MDNLFPKRTGFMVGRGIRAKLNLIDNIYPALQEVLMDGEEVRYVTKGYVINWWEQFFAGGLLAYLMNLTCFILTDRRVLMFNCNSSGEQKHFRNQILYSEIKKAKMKSFFNSTSLIKLKDGKSIRFGGFKGIDRKQMTSLVAKGVEEMSEGAPHVQKSVQYLCPTCPAIYTEFQTSCASCGVTYKSPKKAALMSLVLPGLGDLYLGHRLFGCLELLGSVLQWVFMIGFLASLAAGLPQALESVLFMAVIIAISNVFDYFLTLAMAKKGMIKSSEPSRPTTNS